MADWFVIGGRWSGELSRHSWAKDLSARMDAAERLNGVQVVGAYYADHDTRKKQKAIERLQDEAWRREAPEEYRAIPVNRDTYKEDGYEDDAMILTQELYDLLLKPYEGQEDSEEHADLEYDPVSPDMVGTKWVVVVDYHA